MVKLPEGVATMPHGGQRKITTKWIKGVARRACKTAKHIYLGFYYRPHKKNYRIHRLICEAFHGPPPDGRSVVVHLNENALDNRPSNLKWGTQKENLNCEGFIEYCKSRTGDKHPKRIGKCRRLKESG